MSDYEGQSVSRIAELEQRVMVLQQELAKYKTASERWVPICTSEIDRSGQYKISLRYKGKVATIFYSPDVLLTTDETTMVTAVTENLVDPMILDAIREVIVPEVRRLMQHAAASTKVNKW